MEVSIKGFENYTINEKGEVFSFTTKKYRSHSVTKRGYHSVDLYSNGKMKRFWIHRLVAEAFIPNPNNLPQVNHKDENPNNNHVSNLEWCSAKYNMNYGNGAKTRHSKIDYKKPIYKKLAYEASMKTCKKVLRFDKTGHFIKRYNSVAEAGRDIKTDCGHISQCCKGKRKSAGGYIWKYEGSEDLSLFHV